MPGMTALVVLSGTVVLNGTLPFTTDTPHSMTFQLNSTAHLIALATCLAIAIAPNSANAQELLGYWQLEETDVEVEAADSSGNDLLGIFEGGVDPNVEGAPGFGSGASFDGSSGQVLTLMRKRLTSFGDSYQRLHGHGLGQSGRCCRPKGEYSAAPLGRRERDGHGAQTPVSSNSRHLACRRLHGIRLAA